MLLISRTHTMKPVDCSRPSEQLQQNFWHQTSDLLFKFWDPLRNFWTGEARHFIFSLLDRPRQIVSKNDPLRGRGQGHGLHLWKWRTNLDPEIILQTSQIYCQSNTQSTSTTEFPKTSEQQTTKTIYSNDLYAIVIVTDLLMSGNEWRQRVSTSGDVSCWIDTWRHVDGYKVKFNKSAGLWR